MQQQPEIFGVAFVGGSRGQDHVLGVAGQHFAQAVAAGAGQLAAPAIGGQLVGLVKHDQIPAPGAGQAFQGLGPPGKIKRGHTLVADFPGPAATRRQGRPVHHVKGFIELFGHFPLPLRDEVGRGHNQGTGDDPTEFEFLQEQADHNRLACAGVVGQQKTQTRLPEHMIIDRFQLVREGINPGQTHGKLGIEGVSQADAGGFGGQAKAGRIATERGLVSLGFDHQAGQVGLFEDP